jgi:hypothetical protein
VNRGSIKADQRGLLLEVIGSSILNQGTMEVANGGLIRIVSDFSLDTIGPLTNHGGTFVIAKTLQNAGQTLYIPGPRGWGLTGVINGGTIDGAPGAYLDCGYFAAPDYPNGPTLNNVTLNTTVNFSGTLNITGTLSGNGTIQFDNPEAIEGTGTLNIASVPAGITVRGGVDNSFAAPSKGRINARSNQGVMRVEKRGSFGDVGRRLQVAGGAFTNSGALELTDACTMQFLSPLTFNDGGKLVVDGGGVLAVTGNFNLGPLLDVLEVRPKADFSPYVSQVIATYTGTRTGVFDIVTPGITVSYSTPGEIRISGVPEPGCVAMLAGSVVLTCRRHRRAPAHSVSR